MAWKQAPRTHIDPNARQMAPKLRRTMTEAERVLWKGLRSDIDLPGTHFRRQVPIGGYVVDFCCFRRRLVIEVDGAMHDTEPARRHDRVRDAYLRSEGFSIVRVTNDDVLTRMPLVLDRLRSVLGATTPTPGPSPQGGGEQWSIS